MSSGTNIERDLAEDVLRDLTASPARLEATERELQEALRRRGIFFGEGLLPTYPLPFLVAKPLLDRWADQAERLAAAVEHLAQRALSDPKIFADMRLRPEARELVAIDPGYRRLTVLSRPDAVLRGDDLTFLEFNCDSPAMMSFADLVSECLLELDVMRPYRARLQSEPRTEGLLEALLECWREFGGTNTHPTIAIVDWAGQKTRFEHQRIAENFTARGYDTVVGDPRGFRRVEGGRLQLEGRSIDIVYRRALFTEVLERASEIQPLLSAYRDGAVCMVNPLRSYLASSKTLLCMLSDAESLPPEMRDCSRLVAQTTMLREVGVGSRADKRFVLKKGESHGGMHVLLPDLVSDDQWRHALSEAGREPWVAQEYCVVPKLEIPAIEGGAVVRRPKFFNWNPFLFGGRYAGGIARASDTPLINITLGGGLLPTFSYS